MDFVARFCWFFLLVARSLLGHAGKHEWITNNGSIPLILRLVTRRHELLSMYCLNCDRCPWQVRYDPLKTIIALWANSSNMSAGHCCCLKTREILVGTVWPRKKIHHLFSRFNSYTMQQPLSNIKSLIKFVNLNGHVWKKKSL